MTLPFAKAGSDCKPFIATAIMFNKEYYDKLVYDRDPPDARPCVGCYRYHFTNAVVFLRCFRNAGGAAGATHSTTLQTSTQMQPLRQLYYNVVNGPHGYHDRFVLRANANECFMGCIVRMSLTSVVLRRDAATGRMFADQSAMMYTAQTISTPRAGESLQDFRNGANRK